MTTYSCFKVMISAGTPERVKTFKVIACDIESAKADTRATYGDDVVIWSADKIS